MSRFLPRQAPVSWFDFLIRIRIRDRLTGVVRLHHAAVVRRPHLSALWASLRTAVSTRWCKSTTIHAAQTLDARIS